MDRIYAVDFLTPSNFYTPWIFLSHQCGGVALNSAGMKIYLRVFRLSPDFGNGALTPALSHTGERERSEKLVSIEEKMKTR